MYQNRSFPRCPVRPPQFRRAGQQRGNPGARAVLLVSGVLAFNIVGPTSAQCTPYWTLAQRTPSYWANSVSVISDLQGGLLAFGGSAPSPIYGQGWWRQGSSWSPILGPGPGPRVYHTLVHDSGRNRFVLYGGRNPFGSVTLGDTWEFDGQSWSQIMVTGPGPVYGHAMAYDPTRERTVLYSGVYGGTWEWDGSQWALVAQTGPSPRDRPGMAFDPQSNRVLLFGGHTFAHAFSETWAWDGASWTLAASSGPPPQSPLVRITLDHSLAKVFLVREDSGTWRWDGGSWTLVSTSAPDAPSTPLVFDTAAQKLVAFDSSGNTWDWDGQQWRLSGVGHRSWHSLAYDPVTAETILSGGDSDARGTYSWNGLRWLVLDAATAPHRQVVSRGPLSPLLGVRASQSWLWDQSLWVAWNGAPPPNRHHFALSYDSVRGRAVLFSGSIDGGAMNLSGQTWEFDELNGWALRANTGATPRYRARAAFDPVRQRTVVFGGITFGNVLSGQTWEWDGQQWYLVASSGPAPRCDHACVYVPELGGVLLYGGLSASTLRADTWLWNGIQWAQLMPPGGIPPIYRAAMSYDSSRHRVVLFGGLSSAPAHSPGDTWELVLCPACYPNCDHSTAAPVLNVADFTCFLQKFAAGDSYANCDGSTVSPILNVADFTCFLQKFAAGCQ